MSLSLIGIILVQVYWFNSSLENNDEQFKYHVTQVISNVSDKLEQQEEYSFYDKINHIKDSTGKIPQKEDLLEILFVQRNTKTNKTIVYKNSITSEKYNINSPLFNKKFNSDGFKSFSSKRLTEIYNNNNVIDNSVLNQSTIPDIKVEKEGNLDILNKAQLQISYKDYASALPIDERITKEKLRNLLKKELVEHEVKTKFEFGIYNNNVPTRIKSEGFHYDKDATYNIPIFADNEGNSKYQLSVTFPHKKKFLLSQLVSITILSIVFTLIIIIAYTSALNQLIRQKQISEIKTDFINNMTHEFKTPIATINLALDAIKNPKIIEDKEKVFRYLQMIRDENKRCMPRLRMCSEFLNWRKKNLISVKSLPGFMM